MLAKVEALGKIAGELGITLVELALAWILREENVASALVGASRPEQIEHNVKAVDVELPAEVLARIDEICPA